VSRVLARKAEAAGLDCIAGPAIAGVEMRQKVRSDVRTLAVVAVVRSGTRLKAVATQVEMVVEGRDWAHWADSSLLLILPSM
jgi:hypothetical protein